MFFKGKNLSAPDFSLPLPAAEKYPTMNQEGFTQNKKLTAEIAEYAEAEMAKGAALGCRGKSGSLSHPSRKAKRTKGLSGNDLCALCFLFVHPLVSIPGGSKGKEESISIE